MATATKQSRTTTQGKGNADATSASTSMRFLIFEDNAGEYYWTLLGGDRENLARSPSFASYEDAERAAQLVLDGAGSARLDRAAGVRSVGAAPAPDGLDAERWVNEGGSLNGRALRK